MLQHSAVRPSCPRFIADKHWLRLSESCLPTDCVKVYKVLAGSRQWTDFSLSLPKLEVTERPTTEKSADLFVYKDSDLTTPSQKPPFPNIMLITRYWYGRTLVASLLTRCALHWCGQPGVRASCAAVPSLTWQPSCGVKWCPAPPARPATGGGPRQA